MIDDDGVGEDIGDFTLRPVRFPRTMTLAGGFVDKETLSRFNAVRDSLRSFLPQLQRSQVDFKRCRLPNDVTMVSARVPAHSQ